MNELHHLLHLIPKKNNKIIEHRTKIIKHTQMSSRQIEIH